MKNNIFILLLLAFSAFFSACIQDSKFDEPPTDIGTDTPAANATVSQIRDLAGGDGTYELITQDLTIRAVVISDDRAGNFYKQLIVQDSTGGIEIETYGTFLYAQFPVGREVAIKCKGLILYNYNGAIKLVGGSYLENGVASSLGLTDAQIRDHIIKGKLGTAPTPKVISMNDAANPRYLSTLVQLNNVQFTAADTALTYATTLPPTNVNRTLETCGGATLILRNSGFSSFAGLPIAKGKGSVTAILGTFGTTRQLYIRDLKDVNMTAGRCGGSSGNEVLTPIANIRTLHTGTTTSVPGETKIKGIVTSDRAGKNLNGQNIFIQDASAGIVVRFKAAHSLNLGDEIEIVVSDSELSDFNKLVQINSVDLAAVKLISTGKSVTPRVATIAEIIANHNAWEGSLVKISNCTITGGATLSGNNGVSTINDGSGTTIPMFTLSAATFASTPTPTVPVTLVAIVSEFTNTNNPNNKQIILRNASDIMQ